jgi:hypothetical protein
MSKPRGKRKHGGNTEENRLAAVREALELKAAKRRAKREIPNDR